MTERWLSVVSVVLGLLLLAAAVSVPIAGQQQSFTRGEPDISAFLPQEEVSPGEETTLSVQLQNNGEVETGTQTDVVTTARGVTVDVRDSGPFEVTTGTLPLGSIRDGSIATANIGIEVPEDVEPGEYDLTLNVRYSHTQYISTSNDLLNDRTRLQQLDVTVIVTDEPRFDITTVSSDVSPGTSGTTTLEIANTGQSAATNVRASITGRNGITVGDGAADVSLGDLDAGDTTRVQVETSVSDRTEPANLPISATFEYQTPAGIDRQSRSATATVSTSPAASFSVENLSDTLAVGYSGTIAGELRNDGERTVTDGVLVIEPTSDSISIEERRFALPPVEPGEAVPFAYQTDIGGSVDAGPRQVRFTVEYNNDQTEPTRAGPLAHRVEIDPQRREFSVSSTETRVAAGGSTELVFEITNERPETLENINAKVFADSPLSVDSEEAFVNRLEPGDSATLVFSISAEDGTMAKTYPVEMDFQYETERGESVLSDTYQQPVSVTEPTDDGGRSPIVTGAIVLLVIGLLGGLALAGYRYRQRTT